MMPSKYDPAYCELLKEHMREGGSIEEFAGEIEVARRTLYTWFQEHPEFQEAREVGIELSYRWWMREGKKGLWLYKDGPNLNTTFWFMNMRNRFGWTNKDLDLSGQDKAQDDEADRAKAKELIEKVEVTE